LHRPDALTNFFPFETDINKLVNGQENKLSFWQQLHILTSRRLAPVTATDATTRTHCQMFSSAVRSEHQYKNVQATRLDWEVWHQASFLNLKRKQAAFWI
jgi:hypothetical protein